MKKLLFAVSAAAMWVSTSQSAQIDLQSAVDGSDAVTVGPGSPAEVNLVIITSVLDFVQIAFVNAFLDSTSDCADVYAVTGGQNWTYDRSAFKLPAELDEAQGNEYGLVSGDQVGGFALPLGSATWVIDTLSLSNEDGVEDAALVTFETGAREPQVFGPAPTYLPFQVAPPLLPSIASFIYLGDPGSLNSPFTVNCIPEPASLGLLALGGLALFRRR